jgi:hypothetical protein
MPETYLRGIRVPVSLPLSRVGVPSVVRTALLQPCYRTVPYFVDIVSVTSDVKTV